jgi:MoxR-like ATPase
MQERQVSVEGRERPLADPFLVVATQNPIEYEGTYPLPEAQLDRFAMKVTVGYPDAGEEARIVLSEHNGVEPMPLEEIRPVVSGAELQAVRAEVDSTTLSGEVADYAVAVVRQTRQLPSVVVGASPRAAVHLITLAKAAARLAGRDYVIPDDVKALALPTLRHRVQLRPEAEMEGVTADSVINSILAQVPVPR